MRLLVGALVVCLAVVPAVVRATRVADASGRPTLAPSFKKSFDEPPHAADIPGDIQVTVLATVECATAAPDASAARTSSVHAIDTLRGPPVAVRS
jgi:hypothetical protein